MFGGDKKLSSLLLAISFLTIIPVYEKTAREEEMANSLYFYPLVGFIIGGVLAFFVFLGHSISLGWGADAFIIVLWIIITGGLHLDGVMDSADGIFSGRDRKKKLEIMKDSRVGAMGVITFGALILLKFSFLSLLEYSDKLWVVLLAPATGRFLMVYSIVFFTYARSGPGLGKAFGNQAGKVKFFGAALVLLIGGFLAANLTGLLIIAVVVFISALIAAWIGYVLGGQTGDTYGAICEVSETLFIMAAVLVVALK